MRAEEIVAGLKKHSSKKNREGMSRFGINTGNAFGISIPIIRKTAKEIGKNHELALELWKTKNHEARILAGMIDDAAKVTEKQMEEWVRDFDSWDLCDQCCSNLFDKTPFAYSKAFEWSGREEEFVKRAGFVLMACLSVHDKKAQNRDFERFLPVIKKHCVDERNFVRKAVNWALRQAGKRNARLNKAAIKTAREIQEIESKSAKWIASDALRELESSRVQKRLGKT